MPLSHNVHKTIRLNSSCIENLNRLPSPRTASAQSLESRVLTWTSPTEISDSTQSRSDSSNGRKVMPTSSHIRSLRRDHQSGGRIVRDVERGWLYAES